MVWQFPIKLNIHTAYDSTISLTGISLREMKIHAHIKACTQMCISALSIISKIYK